MRHYCGLFCASAPMSSAWHPISSHGGSKSKRIDLRQVWITEASLCAEELTAAKEQYAGSQDAVQKHQSMLLTAVTTQNEKFIAG